MPVEQQALELAAYLVLMLWFSPLLMSYYLGITLVPVTALACEVARAEVRGHRDRMPIAFLIAFSVSVAHMASPLLRAAGGTPLTVLTLWAPLVVHLFRATSAPDFAQAQPGSDPAPAVASDDQPGRE